jgi:hypothetical protein
MRYIKHFPYKNMCPDKHRFTVHDARRNCKRISGMRGRRIPAAAGPRRRGGLWAGPGRKDHHLTSTPRLALPVSSQARSQCHRFDEPVRSGISADLISPHQALDGIGSKHGDSLLLAYVLSLPK